MDKKPLIGVSLCAVVLLVLGSLSNVVGYQTEVKENVNSITEEYSDITILGVIDSFYLGEGYCLDFIIKNIGTAPTNVIDFTSDTYIFGFVHRSHIEGISGGIEPGDDCTLPITSFGMPLEPLEGPPFIGLLLVRCSAIASNEQNYNNNYFTHSYFIVKLGLLWIFKEMPW